jgi:hypothetical protein
LIWGRIGITSTKGISITTKVTAGNIQEIVAAPDLIFRDHTGQMKSGAEAIGDKNWRACDYYHDKKRRLILLRISRLPATPA